MGAPEVESFLTHLAVQGKGRGAAQQYTTLAVELRLCVLHGFGFCKIETACEFMVRAILFSVFFNR